MASKASISGLTITIGADTKQFSKAMKEIDAEARNIAKDLKTVDENLKLDPSNTTKAVTSLKLLQEQAQKAGEKVKLIQDSIKKLNKEYADGKISTEDYNNSLNHLQMLLGQAKHEQDLTNEKIRQFGKEAGDAGKEANSLGDIIKGNLIADLIQSGLRTVASLARNLASSVLRALRDIARGIVDFTKESLDIAEENRQTLAKVGQVFGDNSQDIVDWSKNAVDSFGLTSGKAQEAAAVFGNMFRALGLNTGQAADMSMNMVQLAADIAAFNNVTTAEVLEDFQSMLAGTSRTVRKYGIVLTEAAVKQKAVDMGLAESVEDVNDAAKAQARYALMVEQTAHQAGQFARESNSATVQTQKLRARIEELQGEIGEKLIPVQARFYKELNDFLASDAGRQLFDGITEAVGTLAEKAIELINDGRLSEWIEDIKSKIPDAVKFIEDMSQKLAELLPKVGELVEKLLALFGIETDAHQFKRETKEALSEVTEEIDKLAQAYGTDSETIRTAIAMLAEENNTTSKAIYEDWATYEPMIKEYLDKMKEDYSTDLIDGSYTIISDFASKNNLSLNDIYNNWDYWMPKIVLYAKDLGDEYDKKFSDAWSYLNLFAERNGISLGEVLENWSTYEPQIKEWYDNLSTQTGDMEKAVDDSLAKMSEDAQKRVNEFSNIDYTPMDSFREKVRGWAHSIAEWFSEVHNLSQNPDYITDSSLTDQSTPDWIYGDDAWKDPFRASGGAVRAGRMYRVNDDAGRRTEWFIPSQNGYILNGNQTDRIVNNNNSRSVGNVNIYVNSYGMNVAEVADELGAAFQNKIRMSGAML